MVGILHNRKTWFIAACHLLILALCATCFTWARYAVMSDYQIYLPTAKSFTASIALDESTRVSVDSLVPGVVDENNKMTFAISNSKTVEYDDGTTADVISEAPLEYTINVYSAGNLPLEMKLAVGETTYVGERHLAVTDGLGEGYHYQFNIVDENGGDTGLEQTFYLDGGTLDEEDFTLSFYWSQDTAVAGIVESGDDSANDEMLSSHERYQKEIETIEIRAVVVAGTDYEAA